MTLCFRQHGLLTAGQPSSAESDTQLEHAHVRNFSVLMRVFPVGWLMECQWEFLPTSRHISTYPLDSSSALGRQRL
jgi:hypothetical protein